MIVRRGLEKGLKVILEELDKMKKEIKPDDQESIELDTDTMKPVADK
jgi:chaperonin GroEL (HSP60 family)